MRIIKKCFFTLLAMVLIATIGFFVWVQDKYVVPIMMYHHVEDVGEHRANWVTPDNFERHMAFLRKNNYNVISLAELVKAIYHKQSLPRNTVVITFDDGYADNYTNAFDILKKYELPVVIFLPWDDINLFGSNSPRLASF